MILRVLAGDCRRVRSSKGIFMLDYLVLCTAILRCFIRRCCRRLALLITEGSNAIEHQLLLGHDPGRHGLRVHSVRLRWRLVYLQGVGFYAE